MMQEPSKDTSSEPNYEALALAGFEAWSKDTPNVIGIDTETTGVEYFDEAFACTIAWGEGGHYFELSNPRAKELASRILMGTERWVFHNAKFDLQKLVFAGLIQRRDVSPSRLEDTEAIAHLLDENQVKRLKELAVNHLGWDDTIQVEIKSGPNKGNMRTVAREKHELDIVRRKLKFKVEDGYHVLPRAVVIPYAISDAVMTYQLYQKLKPQLDMRDDDLKALYTREIELSVALLDVEAAGIRVDLDYVTQKNKEYAREMLKLELQIRKITGEDEFVDHHTHIKRYFNNLGLDLPNVQKSTLEDLDHPLAKLIIEWRHYWKFHSTYLQPILREQRDSIVHPSFRQHGTKTGRMSSGEAEDD